MTALIASLSERLELKEISRAQRPANCPGLARLFRAVVCRGSGIQNDVSTGGHMRNTGIVGIGVAMALILPLRVMAGEIAGTLVEMNGRKPLARVAVRLACAGKAEGGTTSDGFGRYRIEIPNVVGPCTLTVDKASARVFLSVSPARYDFERVGTELRRR